MTLLEFSIFAFSSLFVIVDPIATMPIFLALTPNDSTGARNRMALMACVIAAGILTVFALTGTWIFKFLGITLPAFQIAGSILLMRIALDMLYARRSRERQTDEEFEAGMAKDDIAVSPLAVPLLAGPGAITTVLILMSHAEDLARKVALLGCIVVVSAISYGFLRVAASGAQRLNPLALKLITRLMGLLLAAIAVQFVIDAIQKTPFFAE